MTNANEKMNYLISHAKANINLVSVCFQLINSAPKEERPKLLETFFLGYKTIPTKGDLSIPETIGKDEELKLMHRYGKVVDAYLEELQEQGFETHEFYSQLWDYISSSPVLPNEKARIIAMFDCAIDKRLPYYRLDRSKTLSMENDEYKAIQEAIGNETFAKMKYILNINFTQKTERASLIVQMLDSFTDYKARCVFMTRIISHFEEEMMRTRLQGMPGLLDLLSDE